MSWFWSRWKRIQFSTTFVCYIFLFPTWRPLKSDLKLMHVPNAKFTNVSLACKVHVKHKPLQQDLQFAQAKHGSHTKRRPTSHPRVLVCVHINSRLVFCTRFAIDVKFVRFMYQFGKSLITFDLEFRLS